MTREEFESILEEAFMAGYNDAIDEIFEEDNTFDLEDEYNVFCEKVTDEMDKLRQKRQFDQNTNSVTYAPVKGSNNYKGADQYDFGKSGGAVHDNIYNARMHGQSRVNPSVYVVKDQRKQSDRILQSPARGRIKVGADKSDDPRSFKLRQRVELNRRMREMRDKK